MTKFKRVIIALVGATITAGIIYASIPITEVSAPKEVQKITFANKYSLSTLNLHDSFGWDARYDSLNINKPIYSKLKDVKEKKLSKDEAIIEIKEACGEMGESLENSEWLEDFKIFCTMKNKDGNERLASSASSFNNKYSSFANTDPTKLSEGFLKIWNSKGTGITEEWKASMLSECNKLKEKMYEKDLADKNFEDFCKQ